MSQQMLPRVELQNPQVKVTYADRSGLIVRKARSGYTLHLRMVGQPTYISVGADCLKSELQRLLGSDIGDNVFRSSETL